MSTQAVTSGSPNNNTGTVLFGGTVSSTNVNNLAPTTNNVRNPSVITPTRDNGVVSVFKNAPVTITSVADSSGVCVFTKASHGLAVGDVLFISGSTSGNVDGTHVITAKDTNTFTTNVAYVASATPGVYKTIARVYNNMVAGEYVGRVWGTAKVAGTASNILRSGASDTTSRQPFNPSYGNRRNHITAWDYVTGAATKGASAGAVNSFIDPESGSSATVEPAPTFDVPGRLTYKTGAKLPVRDTYDAKYGS